MTTTTTPIVVCPTDEAGNLLCGPIYVPQEIPGCGAGACPAPTVGHALPSTGSTSDTIVATAGMSLTLGIVLVLASLRRRHTLA